MPPTEKQNDARTRHARKIPQHTLLHKKKDRVSQYVGLDYLTMYPGSPNLYYRPHMVVSAYADWSTWLPEGLVRKR